MDRAEVFEKLQGIITDCTDIPASDIEEAAAIVDDLEITSLEMLMIVGKIEEKFGIRLSESEYLKIVTIGDLVTAVSAFSGK